jgi:hypothetical protein
MYFMCSETCKEHKDNVVIMRIKSRATNMQQQVFHKKRVSRQSDAERRATQHFRNPSIEAHMAEIELAARTEASLQEESGRDRTKKEKKGKKKKHGSRATAVQKMIQKKFRPEQLGAGTVKTDRASQEDRKKRLRSLIAKRQSREGVFDMGGATNPLYDKAVTIEMAEISTSVEVSCEVKVDEEVVEEEEEVYLLGSDNEILGPYTQRPSHSNIS